MKLVIWSSTFLACFDYQFDCNYVNMHVKWRRVCGRLETKNERNLEKTL